MCLVCLEGQKRLLNGGLGERKVGSLTIPLALLLWPWVLLSENGGGKTSHPSFQKVQLAQVILSDIHTHKMKKNSC